MRLTHLESRFILADFLAFRLRTVALHFATFSELPSPLPADLALWGPSSSSLSNLFL